MTVFATAARRTRCVCCFVALALLGAPACGPRDGVTGAQVSAADAAREAMSQYDSNKDGFLDANELERSPALKSALKAMDANKDGKLTAEEIETRIRSYYSGDVDMLQAHCQILFNGTALEGATVRFIPEAFMGPTIKPATGKTDSRGETALQAEGVDLPVMHCGLFRVEVSKIDEGGKETVPARYNTHTTLGAEVNPLGRQERIVFRLSSK